MKHQNRRNRRKRNGKWNRRAVLAMTVMASMMGIAIAGALGHGAAALMASFTAARTAALATVTVSTTNDVVDGDTSSIANLVSYQGADDKISLREAIIAANNTEGMDTIMVPAGVYTLTIVGANDDLAQPGDLDLRDSVKIVGEGAESTIIQAGTGSPGSLCRTPCADCIDRVFDIISSDVSAEFMNLTIRHGMESLDDPQGGGIFNRGTLRIINSTVADNMVFGGDLLSEGGGILNAGTLTITNSTISGNLSCYKGGGIENQGELTITNSTVSGNKTGQSGGGINDGGTLTITNSTVSGNTSAGLGGGISSGGTSNIKNSIVANSLSGGNCDISGTFNTFGVNFSTDPTCSGFNQVNSEQLNLGPLALNAPGATATHALLPGSYAIDAVDDCTDLLGSPVTEDQRGVPRPLDGNGDGFAQCDAGAYEAPYNFTGFFQPVDNPPTINSAKAGVSIPVKFSLNGDQGLNIFATGFPASQMIPCGGGIPSEIEETQTAGNSVLSYDPTLDQYTYVWKTDKAWKNTCRQLTLKFTDGSVHTAIFKFR